MNIIEIWDFYTLSFLFTHHTFSDLVGESPARKFKTKEILQRRPSLIVSRSDTMDDDTFEHILQVTSQHDTIMTYYYLDENNKVSPINPIIVV